MAAETDRLIPELSIVVPIFNEEAIVDILIARLIKACTICTSSFELIIVNDGSHDKSLQLLASLSKTYPQLLIVDLSRNFGHMQALSAGMDHTRGKAVITMDGDLQDPPELIPKLVAAWRDGAQVVLAKRGKRRENAFQRLLTAVFYKIMHLIGGIKIPEQVGTFCLLDCKAARAICSMPERARFFAGLRAWVGFSTATITYERPAREKGEKSKVGLSGQIRLARNGIVSFSNIPLLFLSRLGLLSSLVLCCFGLAIIGIKVFSKLAIPGWASTMVLIGAVGAFNSVSLAAIAEYMAVIFEEIKQRPLYLTSCIYRDGAPVLALDDPPPTIP
jgi:polyisoprenyl-phosphate glycosyltransferase